MRFEKRGSAVYARAERCGEYVRGIGYIGARRVSGVVCVLEKPPVHALRKLLASRGVG